MRHTRPSKRRVVHGGFTLLELMVSIAIFAVLGATAYGGLQALLETRATTEREMQRLATLQKGFALLQQDVEQAIARPVRDAQGDREPALAGRSGTDSTLDVTRAGWLDPAHPGSERLLRVSYYRQGDQLVRSTWPVLDRAPDTAPQPVVVLEEVTELRIRYLDPEGSWATVWPPTAEADRRLPLAVEITLVVEPWGTVQRLFRVPQA